MKTPLTVEEHYVLGAELHRIYCQLQALSIETGRHYPIGAATTRAFDSTLNRLSTLRSKLDNQLFADHPSAPNDAIRAYYPGPSAMPAAAYRSRRSDNQ